jgi:arylsulfatase A-like enzyme
MPPGRVRPGPGLLVAALVALAGCRHGPPDVIVVLADTLRADRVGACGGPPGLTPFLDRLAASGVVFTNAYSTSSWTNPAVASLFTSRFPSQHHVTRFDSKLADDEVTLAERLAAGGWWTLGMVANFRLAADAGYAQGFASWSAHVVGRGGKVRAKRIADDTLTYYDTFFAAARTTRWTRRTRPVFFYLHFMEPHSPYDPPERLRRRIAGAPPPGMSDAEANARLVDADRWGQLSNVEVARLARLYDAEVVELDLRLERLFAALRARGLLERAIVVVTADHGEEFREHGDLLHGRTLYEEGVRVPLIVTGPGVPAGRVVTQEVSLVDVAPTLLALLGLPAEPRFEGRSLLADLGPASDLRDVVLELLPSGDGNEVRRHAAGLIHDRLKVLVPPDGRGPEAYDLRDDRGEQRPNPPAIAQDAAALRARLGQREAALATRAGTAESAPIDQQMRDRLRALGYAH